ncbi:MAG: copper resistance protein CopC/CopD [Chloroflexi bacterium]|nr:copper resistance protein CopC/CopD [Chloroflexota bacterium]
MPLLPQVAYAHGDLMKADPSPNSVLDTPPEQITLRFSSPLEPRFSQIEVFDALGQRATLPWRTEFDPNDPTVMSVAFDEVAGGTYTVLWRIMASDGDRSQGSFAFSVGGPIEGTSASLQEDDPLWHTPTGPVASWLSLLGIALVMGGLVLRRVVLQPRLKVSPSLVRLAQQLDGRLEIAMVVGAALLLVGSVGWVASQALLEESSPITIITETSFGRIWLWRMGALLVLALALGSTLVARKRAGTTPGTMRKADLLSWWVALLAGLGILLALSIVSHTAADVTLSSASLIVDYVHRLGVVLWIGGVVHLAALTPILLRGLSEEERQEVLQPLVARFSALATLCVGTVIVSGLYLAWVHVSDIRALPTPYGITLVIKVLMVAPLLLLGAMNLLWVGPRLSRHLSAPLWLRRFVTGEAVLGIGVLLVVGFMINTWTARIYGIREGLLDQPELIAANDIADMRVTLTVHPWKIGPNRLLIDIEDWKGDPVTATAVTVTANPGGSADSVGLGGALAGFNEPVQAVPVEEGRYRVENMTLGIAGEWGIDVWIERPDLGTVATTYRVLFPEPGRNFLSFLKITPEGERFLSGGVLATVVLLFASVGIYLGRRRLRSLQGATVIGFLGVVMLAGVAVAGPTLPDRLTTYEFSEEGFDIGDFI